MAETTRNVTPVPPQSGLGRNIVEWLSRIVVAFNLQRVRHGSGTPESVVTAPPGTLYCNDSGGAATTLYVKESGTGSTGWVAK